VNGERYERNERNEERMSERDEQAASALNIMEWTVFPAPLKGWRGIRGKFNLRITIFILEDGGSFRKINHNKEQRQS